MFHLGDGSTRQPEIEVCHSTQPERWGSCMSQLRLVFASAMRNDATFAVPILMRYISPCVPLLNGSDDGFDPFKKTEASAVWHVL